MSNKIYIIAGERNMQLAQHWGKGLYVNVGQTTREVKDRLNDDDYRRKAAGGTWRIILQQEVDGLTDKDIHPILKRHSRVTWDSNSNNTEEFLFLDDPGDGSVAKKIVIDILSQRCMPILKNENERLRQQVNSLQTENQSLVALFGSEGIDIKSIRETEQKYLTLKGDLKIAHQSLEDFQKERLMLRSNLQSVNQTFRLLEKEHSTLKKNLQRSEKSFYNLLKGTILTAIISASITIWCWPEPTNDSPIPSEPTTSIPTASGSDDSAVTEPAVASETPKSKKQAVKETNEDFGFPLTPEQEAKLRQRFNLQPNENTDLVFIALTDKEVREIIGAGEIAPAKPPAATKQYTLTPTAREDELFFQFETCIHGQTDRDHDSVLDIMKCNNGNERYMKWCLFVTAMGPGKDIVDDPQVRLTEASACWKKTH